MAGHRRGRIVSRRRVEDDGEEDGSVGGDIDEDSLSEDTGSSHPGEDRDGDGSDASEHELPQPHEGNGHIAGKTEEDTRKLDQRGEPVSSANTLFETRVSETEAMLNGMKLTEEGEGLEELNFDDMNHELDAVAASARQADRGNKDQKRDAVAERRKREHEQYLKEKDANPAFVPTRGGFFLHDKRSTNSPPNGQQRPSDKTKSRPHGLIVDSNAPRRSFKKADVVEGPWRHDLHETVAQEAPIPQSNTTAPAPSQPSYYPAMGPARPPPTAPRSSPPNRSFSSTVLVGNVPVIVYLPGMKDSISHPAVPKKQHTRLPQHRPPLRRDKPVRISLPGQAPRYIFPAMERSFIFIPRALRPNQQGRGRGRGGFFGGKRPSVYAGSTYTASHPMSRRSSMGRTTPRNGVISPAGSMMSRPGMVMPEAGKPVVRLPPNALPQPPPANVPPPPPPAAAVPQPQQPVYPPPPQPVQPVPTQENRPHPIPMHQPRPQKTVSVADIESPMSFSSRPPQEQPFHQQMPPPAPAGHGFAPGPAGYPPHTRTASHPPQASATPLSQIPERAIHAPPFQPVPYQQQQPPQYCPGGPAMYPMPGGEYVGYPVPGPVPSFMPPGQQVPYGMGPPPPPPQPQPQQTSGDQQGQSGTVAHESNGMVYYYDASQFPNAQYGNAPYNGPPPQQGGMVGMGGMMTPPGAGYYYPPQQPANDTVYYA